jgi:hypothetical protein
MHNILHDMSQTREVFEVLLLFFLEMRGERERKRERETIAFWDQFI